MGYITLSKSGVTSVVLSRGHLFPYARPEILNQRRIRAENVQVVRVVTMGARERFLRMHFELLPLSDYQNLRAFLSHANVNFCANTFTVVDTDTLSYTVRWWPESDPPVLDLPEVAYQLYSGDLPLRIEG